MGECLFEMFKNVCYRNGDLWYGFKIGWTRFSLLSVCSSRKILNLLPISDLMLSSSPESLSMVTDRSSDNKSPSPMVSPSVMYKLLVPLLRCEVPDMRDSVVNALGRINHYAIMDLMSELGTFSVLILLLL